MNKRSFQFVQIISPLAICIYYILRFSLQNFEKSSDCNKIYQLSGILWSINLAKTERFQMVRHTLKILQHLLQDLKSESDHLKCFFSRKVY